MHKVEFYFVGGTTIQFTEVSDEVANNIVSWLDNKENVKTFIINTSKQNMSSIIRKELVLFVNVI